MSSAHARPRAALALCALVCALLLGSGLTATSAGDLQSQISAGKSAASSVRSQIARETARIGVTTHGLADASQRLAVLEHTLTEREAALERTQRALIRARDHLVDLEDHLQTATRALAANLVAGYEQGRPDLMSVILDSHGFTDLLERVSFLRRIGVHDAKIVGATRVARAEVSRQAALLSRLEQRDRTLTAQVLAQRNGVAALKAALLRRQIAELHTRSTDAAKLHDLNSRLGRLEAKAAAEARAAAATGNANVAGIAINTGGMVQAPAGAPAAVREVIAAGNAIATLPYIYGGGHGSFHADGYDCSGSVSYALAAAGLVTSPLTSGAFESWGEPGPGRWITVYANAGHVWMEVAAWRFDTVALSEGGTRWSRSAGQYSGYVARHPPGL